MKKLFYVLALGALAACNSGETKEEAKPADTTAVAPAPSTETPAPADTTAAKPDSAAAAK